MVEVVEVVEVGAPVNLHQPPRPSTVLHRLWPIGVPSSTSCCGVSWSTRGWWSEVRTSPASLGRRSGRASSGRHEAAPGRPRPARRRRRCPGVSRPGRGSAARERAAGAGAPADAGLEQVTGLKFKRDPAVAPRSRNQVRDYIVHKFDEDLPPEELAGLQAALRRFGFLPDSIDLRESFADVLTEQIGGYFDPHSNTPVMPPRAHLFSLSASRTHEVRPARPG